MGKFLATNYKDTIEGISNLYNDIVNNPFYDFNDKKPVLVTYYNINKDYTSLDPGSKLAYDNVGGDTPLRFNRIKNFIVYGIDKIELNTEIGEFGLEANPIEGDCYIMPNTIVPTEGDYFTMDHIKDSSWLFIVKDVQKDTLDNGSNVYKISYKLEYTNDSRIQENIVKKFELIETREGTNVISVVEEENIKEAKILTDIASKLKGYFNELFYSKSVQTFIYEYTHDYRIYDPYMIEFIIRHTILDDGKDNYVYVSHVIQPSKTFKMEYDKCIFAAFENKDHDRIMSYVHQGVFDHIVSYGLTFSTRYESYFKMIYSSEYELPGMVNIFDEKLMNHIRNNKLYEEEKIPNKGSVLWKNLIIKHFYDEEFTIDEIRAIEQIDFEYCTEHFYIMPILIYVLEERIQQILQ